MTADFSYRLCILTHGDGSTLERALTAFAQHVTPTPTEVTLVVDGLWHQVHDDADALAVDAWGCPVTPSSIPTQQGFCRATARAWHEGAKPGVTHVFHLEHDFEITEQVNLYDMAAVLDANPNVAQMTLMRQAVNHAERAAGGLYELRRDEFTRQSWFEDHLDAGDELGPERFWLRHHSYFSTNPSLIRRDWMEHHPWPDPHVVTAECEGIYGWALREQGWEFAVWGDGTPNCEHIGVRDGIGY